MAKKAYSTAKGSPVMVTISLVLFVAVLLFGAYSFFQKTTLEQNIAAVTEETAKINDELKKLDKKEIELAQKAQNALEKIKEKEILWSQVIKNVRALAPVDEYGDQKILISSYTAGGDGQINISATSRPDRGTTVAKEVFEDVAEMIQIFNESVDFKNAFIPSIAKGLTPEGNVILSFTMMMEHQPRVKGVKRK